MNSNPEELRQLILNFKEPLVFKNLLLPKFLGWNLDDWSRILKEKEFEFRTGILEYTNEPQWERTTNLTKGSFDYFLRQAETQAENWLYFDYKHLREWLTDAEDLRSNITWAPLGFPHITADDCTIWIGSKGAHTPCHVDTYGFNLVLQVYGRKLWIVAPPEENLRPTRIPYEESSIYSKLNFFSPASANFKGNNSCRKIVLNPGEVLFLPHKWWHYVENLETAISINVWIPLLQDDDERFNEAIVQLLVKQMIDVSSKETNNLILNPNMEQVFSQTDFAGCLATLKTWKNICRQKEQSNKRFKEESDKSDKTSAEVNLGEIIEKYKFIKKVPKLTSDQFKLFLEEQSSRFKKNTFDVGDHKEDDVLELLSVLTDVDVVSMIRGKLLANKT